MSNPAVDGLAHGATDAAPITRAIDRPDPSPTLVSAPARRPEATFEIESDAGTVASGHAVEDVNATADADAESDARRETDASVKRASASPSLQASATPPSEWADPLPSDVTPAPPDSQPPIYRTRIAPAVTMTYAARHGSRHGVTTLSWKPEGERYEARLHSRLPGTADRVQISQGGFDGSGVAPHRFTDRRERGATLAANFQRGAGKITFSGPSVSYPLWMGAQDRLSWVFQLAAVVAAEPERREPGGEVVIPVVDARGDAGLWVFRYVGIDSLVSTAAAGSAARFVREPAGPYDTRVEAWLDPGHHYLPARVLIQSGSQLEGVEWLLQGTDPRP